MSEFFGLGKYLRAKAPQCGSFVPFSAFCMVFPGCPPLGRGSTFSPETVQEHAELLSF